eukprot:TRINITY_DN15320_c0_g1_i1.p1 TRINITY_DN15320_c0_g1~~TRINITY_DN15320_c0_g1_i1.p1  ORF type:complete len:792 (+),score=268.42 TRINITY_DN15320_c0_g1_i1:39-2414(+)
MSGLNDDKLYHLCFDTAEFRDEEDFNPAAFLVEKRKYVPIDLIIKDLVTFREYLQDEVVHLVNTDVYDTFLSVTNKLYQRETELLRLQAPLPEMGARVKSACSKLEDSKNRVGEKLQRIHHLERCKMYSIRKLRITMVEHKLRGDLDDLEKTKRGFSGEEEEAQDVSPTHHENHVPNGTDTTPAPIQNDARLKLIASIAQQTRRLQVEQDLWVAVLDEHHTDRQNIVGRLQQLRRHIEDQLWSEYAAYLTMYKKHTSTASHPTELVASILKGIKVCLEAYCELEDIDTAVKVFRTIICTPTAEDSISWAAARGCRDSPEAMNKLFDAPIEACRTKWKQLIDIGHEAGVAVLVVALWQSFSDTISKRLHFLFESGNPCLFNHRYRAAHRLIAALESCCPTVETLQTLRQEMKLWESRWNTDVYFKMREITAKNQLNAWMPVSSKAKLVKSSVLRGDASGALDAVVAQGDEFLYGPCAGAYSLLMWCTSNTVMMYPLGHKFMALSLEVINTLRNWHSKFLKDYELPVLDEMGEVQKGKLLLNYQLLDGDTDDDDVLLNMHLDLSKLKTLLNTTFAPSFKAHYSGAGNTAVTAIEACLDALGTKTTHIAREVSTALTAAVTLRCINLLGFVGMTPSNLFSKKALPTNANAAASGVLQPLNMFKPKLLERSYPQEVVDAWSQEIINVVTTRYRSLLQDTRLKAKSQQASLSNWRGKKDSAQEGATGTTVTQQNKCDVQFYLDVLCYGRMLRDGQGVDIDNFGPYQRLLEVVKRGAWLSGHLSEEPKEEWLTATTS